MMMDHPAFHIGRGKAEFFNVIAVRIFGSAGVGIVLLLN